VLDAFAYPVSVLMTLLHDLISRWLAPDSGAAWVGSLVLLIVVVRLLLLAPAWKQLRSARRAARLQPQIRTLRRRHGNDHAAYLRAVRDLQRSEGAGVAASLLPLLLQLPVFLGLVHLLTAFTAPGGADDGLLGAGQVESFSHATVFGVPLSAAIRMPLPALSALQPGLTTMTVATVVLPLLLVAAAATFVNAWRSQRRQPAPDVDDPMADSVRRLTSLMVWVSPVGLLLGGIVYPLPLAAAVYWAVSGTWTTIQTQLMTRRLDRLLPLPEV
jgi:YidC/Oxa1 family membrane protein insertase